MVVYVCVGAGQRIKPEGYWTVEPTENNLSDIRCDKRLLVLLWRSLIFHDFNKSSTQSFSQKSPSADVQYWQEDSQPNWLLDRCMHGKESKDDPVQHVCQALLSNLKILQLNIG